MPCQIWDLSSGKLKLSLTGHISTVRGVAVSHRSPYLFSCGEDKQVKCWDLEYNKVRDDNLLLWIEFSHILYTNRRVVRSFIRNVIPGSSLWFRSSGTTTATSVLCMIWTCIQL